MSEVCDLKECFYYDPNVRRHTPVSQWKKECQECWHSKYALGYGHRCNFITISLMIGRTQLSEAWDSEILEEAKKRGLIK